MDNHHLNFAISIRKIISYRDEENKAVKDKGAKIQSKRYKVQSKQRLKIY